ncbi:hypothetical protein K402DRAFT_224819 [Aulographum hederae CBS 113979]|uniref:Uncharacterized protein n=1 Tax=Aulographum hederae CBS 113979 TaxID=1176131 RepID=A0A6G1HB03_9PEZI|nr:hypothetical protein K402DRAFT_224819 [Aulographum hederae CBS 113979]
MALELHIWGPAFGLPSIDPECTAAAVYLAKALPDEIKWTLVAACDPSVSSCNDFPLLRDGDAWISGFPRIVKHVEKYGDSLDAGLSPQEKAESVALSTFIISNAQPLLDLYLYASYENYYGTTRPAFTNILPWHANYSLPLARRRLAKARAAHLGLTSLDLDNVHQSLEQRSASLSAMYEAEKKRAEIRGPVAVGSQTPMLPVGKTKEGGTGKGLLGLLRQPVHSDLFKLESLAFALLEPLIRIVRMAKPLVSKKEMGSVDILAFAYLAPLIYAPVPQPWLADIFKRKFPEINAHVEYLRKAFVEDGGIDVSPPIFGTPNKADSQTSSQTSDTIPWKQAPPTSAYTIATTYISEMLEHLPGQPFHRANYLTDSDENVASSPAPATSINPLNAIVAVSAGLVALLGSAVYYRPSYSDDDHYFEKQRSPATESKPAAGGSTGGFNADFGEGGGLFAGLEALGRRMDFESNM